jgi:ADP-ribosylglycohydrolase
MTARQDRIAGGLIGLLVGDALGVPYEPRRVRSADRLLSKT